MSRIEAAVKAWDHYWGDRYGDEALEEMGDEVKVALDAADAHDAAHGIHRVSLDEETVERAARKLDSEAWNERAFMFVAHGQSPEEVRAYRQAVAKAQARNILAAAVEAGQ